jgi:hypothetical protein
MWRRISFGRYLGKTLPQVVFVDPDWFFWAIDEGCFRSSPLRWEAEEVARRARRIRVPGGDAEKRAMYTTEPTGRFAELQLVPTTIVLDGGSRAYLRKHIDLSFPRQLCDYDKGGGRILVQNVKEYLFGDASFKMSEGRAATFFRHDTYFCLVDDCPACTGISSTQLESEPLESGCDSRVLLPH